MRRNTYEIVLSINADEFTHRLRKLVYSHLFTDCSMKISFYSSEQNIVMLNFILMSEEKSS